MSTVTLSLRSHQIHAEKKSLKSLTQFSFFHSGACQQKQITGTGPKAGDWFYMSIIQKITHINKHYVQQANEHTT